METTIHRPKWEPGAVALGLLIALLTAVYKSMDNITVHHYVTANDGLTAAFSYLIIGGWTGVILSIPLAYMFGKMLVDSSFNGIVINNKLMHRNALVSGVISAGSTLFLLWGNQFGDPSALSALAGAAIVYTAIYDIVTKQAKFRAIVLPVLGAIAGGIMAANNGSFSITISGIVFVLLLSNGLNAISEVFEQKGARASDGVNLFIWRFFWLAFTGTIIALSVSSLRGTLDLLFATVTHSLQYLWFIIPTMAVVFLAMGMKFTLKKKYSVSVVMLIISFQLVFTFPITIIGETVMPGLFGGIPTEPTVWAVRITGALVLLGSIFLLRKNDPKLR